MDIYDVTQFKVKKKHHYVPQFYLKKWLTVDGLWVKNRIGPKEIIYPKKSTSDVAEENYFYGIEIDDVVWDMLFYRFGDEAKNSKVLKKVMDGFWFLKVVDDVVSKEIGVVNRDEKLLDSAKAGYDYLKKTHLEDAYSNIESAVSKRIEEFSKVQDSNLWIPPSAETYLSLITFFGFQLFRTKEVISRLSSDISNLFLQRGDEEIILSERQKSSFLKCLLYMISNQFCMRVEKLGCHMVIHRNRTKQAYLTSDSPAIYYDKQNHPELPQSFGVMPLSPKLLIDFRMGEVGQKVTVEMKDIYNIFEIQKANKLIDSNSHNFVFARKKKDFQF
ncbi:DUF4238 domain-containing protein [Pseudomonas putida]|uniref:DUF4238 domain-containing protein n=1 Tax=Pseudomonas putida TaxID=303 RepID=UPI0008195643|nr:DUF4238 domain-containing protein [Pseudomonas putida]OCT24037.1 hypothetical protein A6E23_14015 [Pseudomonas putida]OCT27116.1 hypothetical protein A6E20_06975 [Pseudomonas putida]OCT28400.1 hypothetical protein A6E24_06790 [Pseudomonas putida]OCT38367.1 hypothetical protein A6E19_14510 [Pseudomonas putida]